jgi:uncharacterized protein
METTEPLKDIVIIYHKHCHDGFGAAWAAFKKFGDTASYIPQLNRDEYPEGVENKEVYTLDFCFTKKITDELIAKNKSLTIIDHHSSDKETIMSVPNHSFSLENSGAKLAWLYFHPNETVPELIEYISDGDTWAHVLPSWREIEGYIHNYDLTYKDFDELDTKFRTDKKGIIEVGAILMRQFDKQVEEHVAKATLVTFEGYEVYACNAPSFIRSELGHRLATKKGPFSLVYRFEGDVLRLSLRGDGSIDVSALAGKYGGGGHHDAAAILFKDQHPLPFNKISQD